MHNPNIEPPEQPVPTNKTRGRLRFVDDPFFPPIAGAFSFAAVGAGLIATRPSPEAALTVGALLVAEVGLIVRASIQHAKNN